MSGYILHAHSDDLPTTQVGTALIPSLAALGLDIPVGSLVLCHSVDQTGNGGPLFNGAWKRLDADANAHDNLLLGLIATGSDPGPSITWPQAATFIDRCASIAVFVGDVWPDINTILCGTSDRGSNSTALIVYGGCTISADNALVIAAGHKFKTATSNGATIADISDGNPWTQIPSANNVRNGNTCARAWNYWQQSTKTNTVQASQAVSIADTNANTQGSVIALRSQVASGGLVLLDDRGLRGEL